MAEGSRGRVGHSGDRGEAALSHYTRGFTGTVWTVNVLEGDGDKRLVTLCYLPQGHKWTGKGRMKNHSSVGTHTQGYTAH